MKTPYPDESAFVRIGAIFPYSSSQITTDDMSSILTGYDSTGRTLAVFDTITWVNSVNTGMSHIKRSYVFMNFYIEQGAPEHINFEEYTNNEFVFRDYFYYFADIFFHKLLSVWDVIGHIIDLAFRLHVNKPDFEKVINKLRQVDPEIYALYAKIISDGDYKRAKEMRNALTHNVPLGVVDNRPVQVDSKIIYFGTSKYTAPSEIIEIANKAIPLLEETMHILFGKNKKN